MIFLGNLLLDQIYKNSFILYYFGYKYGRSVLEKQC